jgi:hypothetical protein
VTPVRDRARAWGVEPSGAGHGQPGLGRARVGPGGRIGLALPVAPAVQALGDAEWIGREDAAGPMVGLPGIGFKA